MFSVEQVRGWLRGSENELLSGQDSDMLLASYLSAVDLTSLYQEGGALTDRRDVIALAIVNRLDWLQDEDEWDAPQQPGEAPEKEIASLTSFVRSHLDEFKAADERIGFGVQFGRIVLPWATPHNGDAG